MKKRKRKPPTPAWQKRVIAELRDLEKKHARLGAVLSPFNTTQMSRESRILLRRQHKIMDLYIDVLRERIEDFNA